MSKEILEQVKKESGVQILNIPYQEEIYIDYMMKLAFNKALEIATDSALNSIECYPSERKEVEKSILKHKIE